MIGLADESRMPLPGRSCMAYASKTPEEALMPLIVLYCSIRARARSGRL